MSIQIILIAVSISVICTRSLFAAGGLLDFVTLLIDKIASRAPVWGYKKIIKLWRCQTCWSGWIIIFYGIYLMDFAFIVRNAPIAMLLAYYLGKAEDKYL